MRRGVIAKNIAQWGWMYNKKKKRKGKTKENSISEWAVKRLKTENIKIEDSERGGSTNSQERKKVKVKRKKIQQKGGELKKTMKKELQK